jgi:hypothetical protein
MAPLRGAKSAQKRQKVTELFMHFLQKVQQF